MDTECKQGIAVTLCRDIGKAVADTEHCLVYLNTLQPWMLKLNQTFSPEGQIRLFPPLMMTLLLVWQHSGYASTYKTLLYIYSSVQNFVLNTVVATSQGSR